MEWTVLVPVKRLAAAKSRLRGAVPAAEHEALVLAMVLDTVAAATLAPGVAAVVVVTADPAVAAAAGRLGTRVAPEPSHGGLNPALTATAGRVARAGRAIAALPADLPALRPAELGTALAALGALGAARGYVPDAAGSGTVLLGAAPGLPLAPRFGPGSAAAHRAGGARLVPGDWPTLRHDVDTPADLAAAVARGVGPHTRPLVGVTVGRCREQ